MKRIYYATKAMNEWDVLIARTEKGLSYLDFNRKQDQADQQTDFFNWCNKHGLTPIEEGQVLVEDFTCMWDYLNGKNKSFETSYDFYGTPFQKAVWEQLVTIPYGETVSYSEIASAIGNPKAVRAVGGAIGKNPVMVVVPCHRVIGRDGSLTGFSGGLAIKEYLLSHEKRVKQGRS